jgi:hypothetical protein
MLKEDALSILYQRVEQENLDILHFSFKYVYEEDFFKSNGIANEITYDTEYTDIYTGRQFFTECLKHNDSDKLGTVWCWLYSRSFLVEYDLRFYDNIVSEDVLFSFMAMMKAKKVSHINDELYIYRKRNNSITAVKNAKHNQSMFIVFMETVNYWKNNIFTEEENEAIKSWILMILDWCVYFENCIRDDTTLQYGTAADKFLYEIIKADRLELHRYIKFSDEKKGLLKNTKSVIIYGCGSAARECYWYLDREGIKIKAFAVSSMEGNPQRLHQLDVVQVDNLKVDKDDLFIVAVSKKYQAEIVSKLNSLGYTNVLLPD